MTLDNLVYRIERLWKVAALGVVFPLITVWAASSYHGADFPVLLALAFLIPTVHALFYPGMWAETLTVSLILSLCLCLAAMMEPNLTTGAVITRVFWLCVLALILFLVLVSPMAMLQLIGPTTALTARATCRSPLDAETLRRAITLYPGKSDTMATCGPADDEGRFPVTLHLQEIDGVNFEIVDCEEGGFPDDLDASEAGDDPDCTFHAVVNASDSERHEIFTYFSPEDIGVQRHLFRDLGAKGTEVTVEEAGHHLTWGQKFGFWLTGYMADYLTHVLDLAEGRRPRANRAFAQKQLVVDLANLILPWLGGQRVENPEA